MEILEYLQIFWLYFPYLLYIYVCLTFIPKSFARIKKFADADYEANRYKYHRCYGDDDMCCHRLVRHNKEAPRVKTRKPVTRIYPKQHDKENVLKTTNSEPISNLNQRRPVQTYTQVNKIARMFETGGVSSCNNNRADKKINRVPPIIIPTKTTRTSLTAPVQTSMVRKSSAEEFAKMLLAENALNLQNFEDSNWQDVEQFMSTTTKITNIRRGTSATPSTASPAASCSPVSTSPVPSSRQNSPTPNDLSHTFVDYKSSLDDIFAAIAQNAETNELQYICNPDIAATLSPPVTSIDDILSERRLSRPLSAYSLSELLLSEDNQKQHSNADTRVLCISGVKSSSDC